MKKSSAKNIEMYIGCYPKLFPEKGSGLTAAPLLHQPQTNELHTNPFTHQQPATCNYQRAVFYRRLFPSRFTPRF